MAVGERNDPLLTHAFAVELDGLIVGGFAEVSGLGLEVETLDYREGGVNTYLHRLPGPARAPASLTLRRGVGDDALWAWMDDVAAGRISRRNGSVMLLDAGQEAVRWDFVDGYPVRWSGPELRAGSATVALESLEIAHRGLSRAEGRG
jgi:phage tail-like protein